MLYNRLAAGMKLQLDSTVIYAVNSPGTVTTTDEERANPSPYNTYVHDGLPPGAISNGTQLAELRGESHHRRLPLLRGHQPAGRHPQDSPPREEHEQNVAEFQARCRSNPQHCTGG